MTVNRMGRRRNATGHLDLIDGSAQAKERAECVLLTLSGELSREEAARHIGVSARRIRQMRETMLCAAVASLEPGKPGRPRRHEQSEAEVELERLEVEAETLAHELRLARAREELAEWLPNVQRGDGKEPLGKGFASGSSLARAPRRWCAPRS